MRVISEIAHERYKIQIFNYNAKYIIKVELGQFEQLFKISETEVSGLNEIEAMVTEELLANCLTRFISMRSDFESAFQNRNVNSLK
ncbi:MAG: hypothetical protein PHQ74_03980 [Crocinitomicaceae bacterium]|nr:hypothetical protein [Crocinitomicaceae bacterium]